MFDDQPKVGDMIKVMGKVKSIDEDNGEVDVSYDDVSIVKNMKKSRDSEEGEEGEDEMMEDSTMSNSQSLDDALSKAFPQTQ